MYYLKMSDKKTPKTLMHISHKNLTKIISLFDLLVFVIVYPFATI